MLQETVPHLPPRETHNLIVALQALKLRAEAYLESLVDSVVITVPSHFSPQQRLATMNAATASGLERVSLLQVCQTHMATRKLGMLSIGCFNITTMHFELFQPSSEALHCRRTPCVQTVGSPAVQCR